MWGFFWGGGNDTNIQNFGNSYTAANTLKINELTLSR